MDDRTEGDCAASAERLSLSPSNPTSLTAYQFVGDPGWQDIYRKLH